MTEPICKECGLGPAEHHAFVAIRAPKGCVCDARDWGDPTNIPPVCEKWEDDAGLCAKCEHEKDCHKSAAAPSQADRGEK